MKFLRGKQVSVPGKSNTQDQGYLVMIKGASHNEDGNNI